MSKPTLHRLPTVALAAFAAAIAQAETIYGLTDSTGGATASLVRFDSGSPQNITTVGNFTGIESNHQLRSIDFRPSNGTLYALSTNADAGLAQLYTVNLSTGALTTVGSNFTFDTQGDVRISMDFNPVADILRVVAGEGNNLRIDPNTGAIAGVDGRLNYDQSDTNFDPQGRIVVGGIAYTNNVPGATSTTLYGYDWILDSINTIGSVNGSPTSPNTGLMYTVGAQPGSNTGGFSAISAGIGFDISGLTGIGYLTLDERESGNGNSEFYTVNLGTGRLSQVGTGDMGLEILDISAAPVPEPASMIALGAGALALVRRRRKA